MILIGNKSSNNDNFWVAYADLMAGLLFVFILLIGAIVVKYVFTQDDLSQSKKKLALKEKRLEANEAALATKETILQELSKRLSTLSKTLDETTKNAHDLEANVTSFKNRANDLNLSINQRDIQILALLKEISQKDNIIKQKDKDLKAINAKIDELNQVQSKIADELKEKLGKSYSINASNGAISLPSSVLFDKDSYTLKPEIKERLRILLNKYFNSILNDPNILANIENIVIEGHTDSDGSYIYNLDLSQKRAYEVMSFIYTFYKDPRLQKLLIASGRSYSQLIYKNQKEDKEASRRIEIKFNISLKKAIGNLQDYISQSED